MTKVQNCSNTAAIFMAFSVIGALVLVVIHTATSYTNYKYAITIDAGSTHSKIILFKWKSDKLNDTGIIEEIDSCDVKPGISSFLGEQVSDVATDIMHCISSITKHLNTTSIDQVFIYLGATAGMRVLNLTDPQSTSQIFETIKVQFELAGLNYKRVSIITGKEEGLFAWVAANYLSGAFFDKSKRSGVSNQTYGVLDMGGASAQIAHQVNSQNATDDVVQIKLYGHEYSVSSYSNLCFGAEQALNRYFKLVLNAHQGSNNTSTEVQIPCLPKGLSVPSSKFDINNVCTSKVNTFYSNVTQTEYQLIGSGEVDKCQKMVNQMLDSQTCKENFQFCFRESFEPKQGTFYAISAYHYLTNVLNLKNKLDHIPMDQYLNATRKLCETSKNELLENDKILSKYIHKYCFQLLYIYGTLTKIYHFDNNTWPNLKFTNYINNSYLGWTLGFIINETNQIPMEYPTKSIIDPIVGIFIAVILLFVFLVSGALFWNSMNRKRMESQIDSSSSLPMTQSP